MNVWLSQNSHSSAIVVPSQRPMVTMSSLKDFPVGAMVFPLPLGIGRVKVPVMVPITAVQLPDAMRIG